MTMHQTFAPTPTEIERLLYHMRTLASMSESDWSKGFALSMLGNAKRRNWTPTPKQFAMMSRLVNELFTHADQGGEIDLIED